MVSSSVCERVLSRALSRGGTFAEIFIEDSRNFSMSLRDGRIENAALSRPYGAGVRVYDGLRSIYVYTCDVSETGLLRAADRAAAAVTDTPKAAGDVRLAERAHPDIHPVKTPFLSVEAARRADVLRQADQAARAVSPSIVQVSAGLISREQHVLIANSEGLYTGDTRVYTRLLCSAVASDGRENQTGTRNPGAMMGFELFDGRVDPAQTGREAAQAAATMLTAPYCAAGEMPVVIAGGFGGVIFHEACGHALEATSVAPGTSVFAGKLGQQIAAPCVTAIDDGTMPNEWGSENIDDEGTPTQRLVLIENGVLRSYMVDRLNGLKMGMAPTGSARRENYTFAPTSRMHNTFIAPGSDDEDEMIRTMGDGLYAAQMGGGSVNTATGEFNFAVQEGYLVRDGKTNKSRVYDRPTAGSKEARLRYRLKGSGTHYHLLEIELLTGRHHQIRAQLSKIGCPIRGDLKYGAARSNRDGSISLHARSIEFVHPVRKEPLRITAPVPQQDNLWKFAETFG